MSQKFLGIDYGEKRVGLAISDENGKLAFPFKILKNDSLLVDMIHNICGEENVREIVIGESLDFNGKENKIMKEINELEKELAKLKLPIHKQKEFLTSVEARGKYGKEQYNARKTKKNTQNKKVDDMAAALILQRYLDKLNK